ncbi:MAG TPA: hypothetical protein VK752_20345 [Bryobacteraceae bacterium]|jgi:hypothetical protein|nr:hypothetical protein [Bryobacteraceae bacterium]
MAHADVIYGSRRTVVGRHPCSVTIPFVVPGENSATEHRGASPAADLLAAFFASAIPAWRAAAVEPMVALRTE